MKSRLITVAVLAVGLALAWVLAATANPASPPPAAATVVKVVDGDTLDMLGPQGAPFRVRLHQIDAPEYRQPWGAQSAEALAGLVGVSPLRLVTAGKDQYGRVLATLYAGDVNINAEMVKAGEAWTYRGHVLDRALVSLEQQARAAHVGLWSQPAAEIIEPLEWRRTHPDPNGAAR